MKLLHALIVTFVLPLIIGFGCVEDREEDLGLCGGQRVCGPGTKCSADGERCVPMTCGDEVIQAQEECDGPLSEASCVSQGFDMGSRFCSADCKIDESRCVHFDWQPLIIPDELGLDCMNFDGTPREVSVRKDEIQLLKVWVQGAETFFAMGFVGPEVEGYLPASDDPDLLLSLQGFLLRKQGSEWMCWVGAPGTLLVDLSGTAAGDVVAVGTFNTVLRYEASRWSPIGPPGFDRVFTGVWGMSVDDLLVSGVGILSEVTALSQRQGENWSEVSISMMGDTYGVWGTAADDVFVLGDRGQIAHFDGTSFDVLDAEPNTTTLTAAWGLPGEDVLVVGGQATIARYQRSQPLRVDLPARFEMSIEGSNTYEPVLDIWGGDAHHVYAVGSAGILKYDGNVHGQDGHGLWRYQHTPSQPILSGISGTEEGGAIVVGQQATVLKQSPFMVTAMHTPNDSGVRGLWGRHAGEVFAVGENGQIWFYDGNAQNTWCAMQSPHTEDWNAISGHGNRVYAANAFGQIAYGEGTLQCDQAWQESEPIFSHIEAIWAGPNAELFAVGRQGMGLMHFDGDEWRSHRLDDEPQDLFSIWGKSPDSLTIVGRRILLHYDGTSLQKIGDSRFELRSVSGTPNGYRVAVGKSGVRMHCSSGCKSMEGWRLFTEDELTGYDSVWAISSDDVFAVGSEAGVIHFDGERWAPVQLVARRDLEFRPQVIWATEDGRQVFFGGEDGRIYRLQRPTRSGND